MKEAWTNILQTIGVAWWIEVVTTVPNCTYYFGPFASSSEAQALKNGYLEDLLQEGARGIQATIKRCKPDRLTIYDEQEVSSKAAPAYR